MNIDVALPEVLPRRRALRAATVHARDRLAKVVDGVVITLPGYRAYLRGMHRFLHEAERALAQDVRHASLIDHLEQDMAALSIAPLSGPWSVHAAGRSRAYRLGWEYVIARSALGARVLLRDTRNLGLEDGSGTRFLRAHASSGIWPRFLGELNTLPPEDWELSRTCASAITAFAVAEETLQTALDAEAEFPLGPPRRSAADGLELQSD